MTANSVNKKKTIDYIDYFKAYAIIFVVLGHVDIISSGLKEWIYAFHMPVFFFASGVLMKPYDGEKKMLYIKKRVRRLIYPYFMWGIIYATLEIKVIIYLFYGSYETIVRAGSLSSLWFLPVLFLAEIFFLIICGIINCKKEKYLIGVAVLTYVIGIIMPKLEYGYPWGGNVALVAVTFLILGYISASKLQAFEKCMSEKYRLFLCCGIFFAMAFFISLVTRLNHPYCECVKMSSLNVGVPYLFALSSIMGILMLLGLCFLTEIIVPKLLKKGLSIIAKNTFGIFVIHKIVIRFSNKILIHLSLPRVMEIIFVCVLAVFVSVVLSLFFSKEIPNLLGKNQKK